MSPADGSTTNKPAPACGVSCQKCERIYFPVLLLRETVVDARHKAALAKAVRLHDQASDRGFSRIKRGGTIPAVRLAGAGFVKVFYQDRGRWDIWQSYADGTYRKRLEMVTPDEYAQGAAGLKPDHAESVCARGAANLPAGMISLIGPDTQSSIWLAFSQHLWDAEVLKDYTSDRHGKRKLRMAEVNTKAWLNGQALPVDGRAMLLTKGILETMVPEFSPSPENSRLLLKVFSQATTPLSSARFGKAGDQESAARAMEKTAGPKARDKALIITLPDPVGIAEEYNNIRLGIYQEHQRWLDGAVDAAGKNADPQRAWKRQSMLLAGYIREWVKVRARERTNQHYDARDAAGYRDYQLISESEYLQIKAEEARTGRPRNPPGTRYEKVPGTSPVMYRVHWSAASKSQAREDVATANAQPRIDRYNEHLDWPSIEATNRQWLEQEAGWHALQQARDKDYVAWLEGETLKTALRHDYADRVALSKAARDARQLKADLSNAFARLQATERCYGGGACTIESLKHLITLFKKDETDPEHWLARSLIKEFDLLETVTSEGAEGTQSDLYDAFMARKSATEEFKQAWLEFRDPAAGSVATLLLVSNQMTQQMLRLAVDPADAKRLGIESQLEFASRKNSVWVRAAAMQDFLASGNRHYIVGVVMADPPDNALGSLGRTPGLLRVEPAPASNGGRRHRQARARQARARTTMQHFGRTLPVGATVHVSFDLSQLQRASLQRGGAMLPIASHDLFGRPTVSQLPQELVDALLKDPGKRIGQHMGDAAVKLSDSSHRLPILAAVVAGILETRALMRSLDDFQKRGGLDQLDVTAGGMSQATGIAGALAELGAIALADDIATTLAGTPRAGSVITGKLSLGTRLRLAGAFLVGAGAMFDATSAFVKRSGSLRRGDVDAAAGFFSQGLFQGTGGISLLISAYIRRTIAKQLAQRVAVSVGLPLVGGGLIAGTTLASWLTGIGFVLWIVGFGVSFWALSQQDDACEIWLDRSFFGLGENQEQGKFRDLEHEMTAFGALSLGLECTLSWNDEMLGPDLIGVEITLPEWKPGYGLGYVIDGFTALNSARPTGRLAAGAMPAPKKDGDGMLSTLTLPLTLPGSTGAIRFTYALVHQGRTLAQDHVWIED